MLNPRRNAHSLKSEGAAAMDSMRRRINTKKKKFKH